MTNASPSPVHDYFSLEKSKIYDIQIRQSIPGYEAMHHMVYAFLSNELTDDAYLLVAGAGTGMEIVFMGKHKPSWRFTAFDTSPEMLAVCAYNLREAGIEQVGCFSADGSAAQFSVGYVSSSTKTHQNKR